MWEVVKKRGSSQIYRSTCNAYGDEWLLVTPTMRLEFEGVDAILDFLRRGYWSHPDVDRPIDFLRPEDYTIVSSDPVLFQVPPHSEYMYVQVHQDIVKIHKSRPLSEIVENLWGSDILMDIPLGPDSGKAYRRVPGPGCMCCMYITQEPSG